VRPFTLRNVMGRPQQHFPWLQTAIEDVSRKAELCRPFGRTLDCGDPSRYREGGRYTPPLVGGSPVSVQGPDGPGFRGVYRCEDRQSPRPRHTVRLQPTTAGSLHSPQKMTLPDCASCDVSSFRRQPNEMPSAPSSNEYVIVTDFGVTSEEAAW
jgi:hypothetical protein